MAGIIPNHVLSPWEKYETFFFRESKDEAYYWRLENYRPQVMNDHWYFRTRNLPEPTPAAHPVDVCVAAVDFPYHLMDCKEMDDFCHSVQQSVEAETGRLRGCRILRYYKNVERGLLVFSCFDDKSAELLKDFVYHQKKSFLTTCYKGDVKIAFGYFPTCGKVSVNDILKKLELISNLDTEGWYAFDHENRDGDLLVKFLIASESAEDLQADTHYWLGLSIGQIELKSRVIANKART